ncbi:extracellular solute-binding protein [Lichenicoccus sp.]|uniref:extracellular solute-binding protein n=1 Tax=Lichenicoccus sp. TaxID=2781899 RepID=UPI003D1459D5
MAGCLLLWSTGGAEAAHTPSLRIATFGGGVQAAQQAALFTPFAASNNVRLQAADWDGRLETLQTRAATGHEDWDLVLMEAAPLQLACQQGLLLATPLVPPLAAPGATANPAPAPDSSGKDCGVAAWRMDLVLAWDKSRVADTPTWNDFWNVAQRPGKRGLRHDPRGTLEIALLADGVAPGDVYRTLATPDGVDRAFRKLDQLKPYIVWWNSPADAVRLIESGAALMTSAPAGEVMAAGSLDHRSFGTQWAQSLGIPIDWAIPRTIPPDHQAPAQKLLGFVDSPAGRADFLSAYRATLPSEDGPASKSGPANEDGPASEGGKQPTVSPTLIMDDGFWLTHLVPLRRRFDRWADAK